MSHNSDIAHSYDSVAPKGARVVADSLIGVCAVHGWWFGLDGQKYVACPEPNCEADVILYERMGKNYSRSYLSETPGWAQ